MNRFFAIVSLVLIVVTSAPAADKPDAANAAVGAEARARNDLALLVDRNVIATGDLSAADLVAGKKADGERVATVLVKLARVFKPDASTTADAVAVLTERGVIGGSAY